MREIKLRAYIKNLKWLAEVARINFDIETVEVNLSDGNGDLAEYNFDEVELMQYTGLEDKNGKEIYEGDIVVIEGEYKPGTYKVIWDSYRIAWWLENLKANRREIIREDDFYQLLNDCWQYQFRLVLGNIYENPELLEVV